MTSTGNAQIPHGETMGQKIPIEIPILTYSNPTH